MAALGAAVPLSKRIFDKYDFDQSGTISPPEFREMVYELGYYLTDREFRMAILMLDTDGDGHVSYPEFLKWWKTDDRFKKLQLSEEQYNLLQYCSTYFQYFDKDRSGVLEKAEFQVCHADLLRNHVTDAPFEKCLASLDTNNDGLVSFNEYVDWLIAIGSISLTSEDVTVVPASAAATTDTTTAVEELVKTAEEKDIQKEMKLRLERAESVLELQEEKKEIEEPDLKRISRTLVTLNKTPAPETLKRLETMRQERFEKYRNAPPPQIASIVAKPGGKEALVSRLKLMREQSELVLKRPIDNSCEHRFARFRFSSPSWCHLCAKRLYHDGLVGYRCRGCAYTVHDGQCRNEVDPKKKSRAVRRDAIKDRVRSRSRGRSRSPGRPSATAEAT